MYRHLLFWSMILCPLFSPGDKYRVSVAAAACPTYSRLSLPWVYLCLLQGVGSSIWWSTRPRKGLCHSLLLQPPILRDAGVHGHQAWLTHCHCLCSLRS